MERNKVMSFGEPSPDPVETADGFMVGGAIMAPPWNIGLTCICLKLQHYSRISQNKHFVVEGTEKCISLSVNELQTFPV